jgi:hypothetical protein
MDKVRICSLRVGDTFEMDLHRWKVFEIREGRIIFAQFRTDTAARCRVGEYNSRACGSKQIVHLIKRANEQTTGVVVADQKTGNGIVGPGPAAEYPG